MLKTRSLLGCAIMKARSAGAVGHRPLPPPSLADEVWRVGLPYGSASAYREEFAAGPDIRSPHDTRLRSSSKMGRRER